MPSPIRRCIACRREFNAKLDGCPFCKTRVLEPAAKTENRWTEPQMQVVRAPGAFLVGRHLENLGVSWVHARAAGSSLEQATRFLETQSNGYGQATLLEIVSIIEKPWPTQDESGTKRWDALNKGSYVFARPSFDWPRVMSERQGLGMLAIALDPDPTVLQGLAARHGVRAFVLRSWGTFETDSGHPIR